MRLANFFLFRWIVVRYSPNPAAPGFWDTAVAQQRNDLDVRVAVMDDAASRKFFGVPMARRGIQPVWVQVVNRSRQPYRLQFVAIDPNYFSPLEAAAANHYSGGKRLLGFGLLAWLLFLPLLILLPIKLVAVRRANRKMDAFFLEQAFRMRPIPPQGEQAGFVFTNLSEGNKVVLVRLLGPDGPEDFEFSLSVRGLDTSTTCGMSFNRLIRPPMWPRWTSTGCVSYLGHGAAGHNERRRPAIRRPGQSGRHRRFPSGAWGVRRPMGRDRGDQSGDLLEDVSGVHRLARSIGTRRSVRCVLFGRSQDFALQRIRSSINERLHLRLWGTRVRFHGQAVWLGQVSRDIGVRLTWRTWNMTTHRIDPDVDEARDYVVEDLMHVGRLKTRGVRRWCGLVRPDGPAAELDRRPLLHRREACGGISVGIADHAHVRGLVVRAETRIRLFEGLENPSKAGSLPKHGDWADALITSDYAEPSDCHLSFLPPQSPSCLTGDYLRGTVTCH